MALDLSLKLHAFLPELESCFLELLVPGLQLLYPQARWGPCIPIDLVIKVIHWGSLSLMDAFNISLGGTYHETFMRGVMAPLLELELEGDSVSTTRRSWKDSMTYSVIPMNPSFIGNGVMCCATRWPTVSTALRRPVRSTVGVLWMRYSGERGSPPTSYILMLVNEKVRWHRSSWNGYGPRKAPS